MPISEEALKAFTTMWGTY